MWDVTLEKLLLSTCLSVKSSLSHAVTFVEEEFFSTDLHSWLWVQIADVYKASRELIDPGVIASRVERDYDEGEVDAILDSIGDIYDIEVSSPKTVIEDIRRFVRMANTRATAGSIIDKLSDGDLEAATEAVDEGHAALRRISGFSEPIPMSEYIDERLDRYDPDIGRDALATFYTFSQTINSKVCPAGFPAGRVGEVTATTNIGKSTFLAGLGWSALAFPEPVVLHITSEDSVEDIAARYDGAASGINRSTLAAKRISSDEKKHIREALEYNKERFSRLLVHYLPKGHRVTMVGGLLESARDRYPNSPILICYDSPYHASGPAKAYRERRFEIKAIWEYLENIVKDKENFGDVAIWGANHAKAKDAGKKITAESDAEGYDSARAVDLMIGLREGAGEGILEANIPKNRITGVKNITIYFRADMGICKFEEVMAWDSSADA